MLADVIVPHCVMFDLPEENKDDLIHLLSEKLCECSGIASPKDIYDLLAKRELDHSTGIGGSVAVPHCRSSLVDKMYVGVIVLHKGIDWDAIDGQPVHFIFLVVGPDSKPEQYLKVLSRISRLMKSDSIKERVLNARSAEEVVEILREE